MLILCKIPKIRTIYNNKKYLQWLNVNFLANRFKKKPIKNNAKTLIMFFLLRGLFVVTASGIAIPMMNKNEGNIRSAGVRPFH